MFLKLGLTLERNTLRDDERGAIRAAAVVQPVALELVGLLLFDEHRTLIATRANALVQVNARLPFKPSYSKFGEVIDQIGLELPEGQLTHGLQHTFASHYMMSGGDILILQKVLGHATLA